MSIARQAGSIAVRYEDGHPLVLVITTKQDPNLWIFPKGHVEEGEPAVSAALRELREEAGVEGTVLEYTGTIEFASGDENVRVDYFLVKFNKQVISAEERDYLWCTYEEAIDLLSFEDSRELLEKAWVLIELYEDDLSG